jgi:ribosome biogenesis protein BMS1
VNYTKKENLDLPRIEGEGSGDEDASDEESEYDSDVPACLLKSLQDVKDGVDEKMEYSTMRLFKGSKAVQAVNSDDDSEEEENEVPLNSRRSVDDVYVLANSFRRRFDDAGDLDDDDGSERSKDDSSSDETKDGRSIKSKSDASNDQNNENNNEYFSDSESDDDEMGEDGEGKPEWGTDIAQQAAMNYLRRERSIVNLQQLVYGTTSSNFVSEEEKNASDKENSDDESSDDEFFKLRDTSAKSNSSKKSAADGRGTSNEIHLGENDSSRNLQHFSSTGPTFDMNAWLEEGDDCLIESIRDKFVTGNWGSGTGEKEEEEFDGFEDLETGEKYGPNGEVEESDDDDETEGMTDAELRERYAAKKAKQKNEFDDDYDDSKKGNAEKPSDEKAENEYVEALKREKEARLKRNQEEFGADGETSRVRYEGFRQGIYCRVRIDGIPAEFVESFNPVMPLVIGGLTPQETERGLVRCRFKKHRWHKKILKCNDPLVFSVGWRRFQSIPVFSTEDQNGRQRYLKYTVSHH